MSLGKAIKCEACRAFSLFRNKFDKFDFTGAQMLDSIYHMVLKLLCNCIFGMNMLRFCHLLRNIIMDIIMLRY